MSGTNHIQPPAVECRALHKRFPGVLALDAVDFDITSGQIHALVGENGAGKSTLVKILAGQLAPDSGGVFLGGREVTQFTPRAASRQGVAMVPQHPDLFHSLSALENLFVGSWPRSRAGTVSWRQMHARAGEVLASMGADLDLLAPVSSLTVAQRQVLQIARALLADARLLILDEPTAPLAQDDAERLFSLVRKINEQGTSIIYISHRLAEVFELAQAVTVLRDGALVGTRPISEVSREDLIEMMVGREVDAWTRRPTCAAAGAVSPPDVPPLLRVRDLGVAGRFEGVYLDLKPGEIVGIAGVGGSGRNELLRAIAGVLPPDTGHIEVNGRPAKASSPAAMRELGVGYVPADRHHEALVLPMTVRENTTLGVLRDLSGPGGLIRPRSERAAATEQVRQLDVRASGVEQPVSQLSGGNQQKVALASRLIAAPRALLLEEPTQGVDVAARAEIHRLMHALAASDVGILLVSSDLPELMANSDRILVMHRGRAVGELDRGEATQQKVLDLAMGTGQAGVVHAPSARRKPPLREAALAAILAVLVGAISMRAPGFLDPGNLLDILVNNAHILIAAAGMTLVILTAGIDISVGSMLAVCATVAAATAVAGAPPSLVFVAVLAAGAVLGAVNAGLITWARIPPIIATLATLTLFRNLLIHFTGGRWVTLPLEFREFGLSAPLAIPLPIWGALVAPILAAAAARWTPLGRSIYAVGSNPVAASHLGISVPRVQFSVYVLAGLLTGLAAFVFAGRWSAIQTNTGLGFEMVVITAVVVGGTNIFGGSGSVLGTVIGVLLLGVISGSLTHLHIDPTWERALQGLLILIAVVIYTAHGRREREAP